MPFPTPYPCSLRGPVEGRREAGYSSIILKEKRALSFVEASPHPLIDLEAPFCVESSRGILLSHISNEVRIRSGEESGALKGVPSPLDFSSVIGPVVIEL
jgi:hypothetical protein